MPTFYSIKYIETRGLDAFEGEFTDGWDGAVYARGKKRRNLERVGTEVFTSKDEALRAGVKKLERAIINLDKKKADFQKYIKELKETLAQDQVLFDQILGKQR